MKGVPEIYWYGTIDDKNILALEILGKTLEVLFVGISLSISSFSSIFFDFR